MYVKKESAIQDIMKNFSEFANLILHQLDLLETVVNTGKVELPQDIVAEIKKNEAKLDKLEVKISDKIVNTISLHHPMASDLRKLMACYRMTINLERIGDLIYNIVNFIGKIKEPDIYAGLADVISNMLISSVNMVEKALISFTNEDKEYAIWTIKNDVVVNEMNRKLLKKNISKGDYNKETQRMLLSFINLHGVISDIERIADHATNIAEASIYSLEGTDLRHKDIKSEDEVPKK
ncbi:hypothetical protein EYV94_26260 [Puteibacter caeruleilacunae]|nr:hypothetical protein EYV94_26260 [Puteibacter caeruleilacunae]